MAAVATTNFADRLAEAVERKRSQLVVGLDPRPDLLPVELKGEAHLGRERAAAACERFCRGLVDAVAPYVVAVKPQVAFFEALGADGVRALENVCAYSRAAGLQVIADAKRGDIGSTARAYATAYLESPNGTPPLADAVTVNPYLGRDSLDPFLAACRRDGAGIFCVVKTSNAGGAEVQDLVLPRAILLLPGVGAQGATPADVARAFTSGPASALVNVSRDVIYAFRVSGMDWRSAAAAEASKYAREVWAVSGW